MDVEDGSSQRNRYHVNGIGASAGRREALPDASGRARQALCHLAPQCNYRVVFECAPYPILLVGASGQVLEANAFASRLYGHDPETLTRMTVAELIGDAPDLGQRLFRERPTLLPANWHRRADGECFLAEVSVAYTNGPEQPVAILMVRDITEARRTIDRLAAAEERWRFALEGADDAVWDWDLAEGRMTISPHLLEKLGWPNDARADNEALWLDRIHSEDVARVRQAIAVHLAGEAETISAEFRLREAQGNYRWKATRGRVMAFDPDGQPLRLIGTLRDIHEQKLQAERERQQHNELAHAGRLMMLGEMASVLAHEINQPLTAMHNFSTLGLKRLDALGADGEPLRKPLEMICSQALRAGAIVDRVRGFVRKGKREFAPVDINAMVRGVLEMSEFEGRKLAVRVAVDFERELPPVHADRLQIEQVVLNLIKNAFDAMGAIEGEHVLEVRTRRFEPGMVEVSIHDNGPGFPVGSDGNVFEPFYTTKPEGLGLGLSISRSIIEAHGGQLRMARHPEGGAIVAFCLPASVRAGGHD